jgi:uncharacterized protein YukE
MTAIAAPITVTPDTLRQAAVAVRAIAALLAEVRGRLGGMITDVLAAVGGPRAAPALAELWARWSASLDGLAGAVSDTASLLDQAAISYETSDAASMPATAAGLGVRGSREPAPDPLAPASSRPGGRPPTGKEAAP